MTHRDPDSTKPQFQAATTLGRMVADGQISPESAAKVMGIIVNAAAENAPQVDRAGLRMRLVHAAKDATQARTLARGNVETAVRWAARPMIAANAPPAETIQAARKAAGDLLTEARLKQILADEWDRAHRRRGRN